MFPWRSFVDMQTREAGINIGKSQKRMIGLSSGPAMSSTVGESL